MARLIPSDLTRLALAGAHQPEVETRAILQMTWTTVRMEILCTKRRPGLPPRYFRIQTESCRSARPLPGPVDTIVT
jgi:hypothetical protein